MEKIRVYELAKVYKMKSKDLITKLTRLGIEVNNHMSVISEEDYQKFMDFINPNKPPAGAPPVTEPEAAAPIEPTPPVSEPVVISEPEATPEPEVEDYYDEPEEEEPVPVEETIDIVDEEDDLPAPKAKPAKKAPAKKAPAKKAPEKKAKPAKQARKTKAAPVEEEPRAPRSFKKRKRGTRAQYRKTREDVVDLSGQTIEIDEMISLAQLAETIQRSPNELIMKFMEMGEMYTMNSAIPFDEAALIASEFDITLERRQTLAEVEEETFDFEDKPENLKERAPIVTVMGHVDHGKTSILDAIRSTNITKREAGGITQHIGASEINYNNKRIVFLDTPGHEAFTTLRARGAQVTDIAILVVAADDGVMPQTIEAIHHAQAAEVPIIVAINKMDKASANPDRVKQELTEYGLVAEEWGGDTIMVPVSALTGENIEALLDMILLVAEMQELKANPKRPGVGTIIEANVDPRMGTTATVLLEKGTMKIGDNVFAGASYGRVRTMINDKGKRIKTAGPTSAFEITGLNEIPQAGDKIYVTDSDQTARQHAEQNEQKQREAMLLSTTKPTTLDTMFEDVEEGELKELNLILRADVHGSVEAIRQSLEKISTDEVAVNIIKAQVGAISEADILLASASNAVILGFNVRPNNNIQNMAERENIEIRTYRIIYEIINDVRDALSGMLDPDLREEVEGNIEVREIFKVPGVGTIAGGYVQRGKISRSSQVRLVRDGIVIHEGEVSSLKRFKDDVRQVATGYECGIGLRNYNDIKVGDMIETFIIKEIERNL
ncbi:MAG TPA: translation initiation factor IF-2 [Tissierellia bacterium]|nr:translation initiation factor IF-2 [Tissierellia bacterium]